MTTDESRLMAQRLTEQNDKLRNDIERLKYLLAEANKNTAHYRGMVAVLREKLGDDAA